MTRAALLDDVPHLYTGTAEGDLSTTAPGRSVALAAVLRRLGSTGPIAFSRQVHGNAVRVVERATPGALAWPEEDADAMITRDPGVVLAVRVADCVPILLAAPGGVAAIHAGWRGTAADITRGALAHLVALTGCRPTDVRASIGPAICGSCYEVGDEVVNGVAAVTPGDGWRIGPRNVDLRAANAAILRDAGVTVQIVSSCTRCGPGYWSFRRDGAAAGRQAAVIGL